MARNFDLDEETITKIDGAKFSRMLTYVSPHRYKMALTMGLMVVAVLANQATPYLIEQAIDVAIPRNSLWDIALIAFIYLLFSLLGWLCTRFRIKIMSRVGQTILHSMRENLFLHIQKLSLRFYDSRPAGKIMARLTSDVNTINEVITDGVINMMTEFLNLVVIIAIMLSMDLKLALITMVTLPLLIGIGVVLRPRLHQLWHTTSARNSAITANLNESITGMKVTQAFSRQEKNLEHFTVLCKAHLDQWMRAIRLNMLFGPLSELSGAIGLICVFWFGVHDIRYEHLDVGVLVAFTSYLGRFWGPISNLTGFYVQIQVAMASADRVFEFLDTTPEIVEKPNAPEMKPVRGEVAIENVDFSYDGELNVLHGVNLRVEPGQTVALVGPTGAGKSSIINLLCRFYDPVGGAVKIDGVDIRDVTLASLRRQIGIVLQDTFIFPGTIEQNIRYGRLDATDEEVRNAAKAVQIHEMIESWPDGYQTEVEERGSKLSVGQRQLLAFARALLADPKILILDEATSSIDTETESHLQQALQTLLKGRTAFIIAHRMSTIRHADQIVVVDQGRIMEQGTHEELLDQKGIYYRLCRVQIREILRGQKNFLSNNESDSDECFTGAS